MSELLKWHRDTIGEKVVSALTKNNFTATYVKTREEATAKLLELIPLPPASASAARSPWAELGE